MASLAHQVISGKTLSSPATLNRLQEAVQRSVALSDGWDVMQFAEQLQKLAAGNVAFATIPVLDENGWSDDGMQSVVRVDANRGARLGRQPAAGAGQGQDRGTRLHAGQDRGRGGQRHRHQRPRRSGVRRAHQQRLRTRAGRQPRRGRPARPARCSRRRSTTLARKRFPRTSAACRSSPTRPCAPGTVRVVLGNDYTGPGSGLDGTDPTLADGRPRGHRVDGRGRSPCPSPIITAGSDNPDCVN